MILKLIEENYVAVELAVFLILFIATNNNFSKRTNRLFMISACCVLILIVEEAWEAQLALAPTLSPLRVYLSALGYILRPMIPYLLCLTSKRLTRTSFTLLTIPVVFNVLVAFSSLFCKISFGYTADNQFVRGPLGYTPFWVAGLYVCIILVHTMYDCRKGGFTEALIVSAIVLVAMLSTILESMFHIQFIQIPSMATSIVFYYLFLHSNQNYRDVLTGALTRRRFYLDADRYRSSLSAIISLDINDMKFLNDQYGHVRGDQALVDVCNTIKRHMGMHSSLYRTGGDEFMILCYKMDPQAVQELVDKVHRDLEKTEYRCAMGYALCSPKDNFDAQCQISDNAMYEDKRRKKGISPES